MYMAPEWWDGRGGTANSESGMALSRTTVVTKKTNIYIYIYHISYITYAAVQASIGIAFGHLQNSISMKIRWRQAKHENPHSNSMDQQQQHRQPLDWVKHGHSKHSLQKKTRRVNTRICGALEWSSLSSWH